MDIDSELVGKNFLYMLTEDTYATMLKEAFERAERGRAGLLPTHHRRDED